MACDLEAIRARLEAATPAHHDGIGWTSDEETEFFAHAREDVAALLEECERLRAALADDCEENRAVFLSEPPRTAMCPLAHEYEQRLTVKEKEIERLAAKERGGRMSMEPMGHDHLAFVLAVQTLAMVLDLRDHTVQGYEVVGKACGLDDDKVLAGLQATDGDHAEMARQFVRWQREGINKPEWAT